MDKDNLDNFLKDLTELTKKYHLSICGCGCCDSPALDEIKPSDSGHYVVDDGEFMGNLKWKD